MSDPAEKLSAFVAWAAAHITGDEKGQAQIFLDRLFQALGHAGSLDVGGEPEFRVRKATEDGGGTSFADYVWKPVVLIEMKKRGTVLSKHYRLDTEFPSKSAGEQMRMSYLSAQNFFGLDINPFAIEFAKVTMMIARKLAIDELHITERALPLDNLDGNFIAGDALFIESDTGFPACAPSDTGWKACATFIRAAWPPADVIIGIPPAFPNPETLVTEDCIRPNA